MMIGTKIFDVNQSKGFYTFSMRMVLVFAEATGHELATNTKCILCLKSEKQGGAF